MLFRSAEFLLRLLVRLGVTQEQSRAIVAAGSTRAAARLATVGNSQVVQLDDDFDRAWRRVGQSLDRHGFTVEDRDRKLGLFFLRYADPNFVGKEEPNFFAKLFGFGKTVTANRYRVLVKSEGSKTVVTITDSQGTQQTDDNAKRILSLLQEDLR